MGLLANLGLNIVKLKQYEEETEKAKRAAKKTRIRRNLIIRNFTPGLTQTQS